MIDMFSSQAPYGTSPFGLPDGAAQLPLMQQLQQLPMLQQMLQQQLQQQQQFQQQPFGQQLQPQGFFGNLLKQYGAPVGSAIGGLAGQLGGFLPFQAMPQFQQPFGQQPFGQQFQPQGFEQQLQPQGFFGNLLKQYGAPIGSAIGSLAGQLGGFLPFQAMPQFPQLDTLQLSHQFQQQPFGQQFVGQQVQPQGFFGNILKHIGAPVGGAIGGAFGNQGLGQTIGGMAGHLGSFLPFQAMPQFQQQPFGSIPQFNLPIQFAQQPGFC